MPPGRCRPEFILEREEKAAAEAREAAQLARVALIVSAMAFALAVLGLFLPIR